jgi:membrane protein implicated in regulation of membrane protease activity
VTRGKSWYARLATIVGAAALFVASQQTWGIGWSLLVMAVAVVVLGWQASGIRRRYVEAKEAEQQHGPYTESERRDLERARRRTRVVCWCILPLAAAMVALAIVTDGTARGFLLIFSIVPAATAIALLTLLAVKGRRGTLPGQRP